MHSVSKNIYDEDTLKTLGGFGVITEQKSPDSSCFSLTRLPPPPSQLLTIWSLIFCSPYIKEIEDITIPLDNEPVRTVV